MALLTLTKTTIETRFTVMESCQVVNMALHYPCRKQKIERGSRMMKLLIPKQKH